MILLHRCYICGDLATRGDDGEYICGKLNCEVAHLFVPPPTREGVG